VISCRCHNIENHKKHGWTDNFSGHLGFRSPFAESLHGAAHPRSLTQNGYSRKHASAGPVGDRGVFSGAQAKPRVKAFVGTWENALQWQLWTALIAILLIKYLQLLLATASQLRLVPGLCCGNNCLCTGICGPGSAIPFNRRRR